MEVKVKKLDENAKIPEYAFESDAGADMFAVSRNITDDYIEYGTGLAFDIPEGFYMEIFPRSSISKYNLLLCNSVGVIDESYKGEIKFRFKVINRESVVSYDGQVRNEFKQLGKIYEVGDKIGQIILKSRPKINFIEVDGLTESDRGTGGYGSTGS